MIPVVLVGDAGTGKSCFLHNFADGSYDSTYMPTIGVDLRVRHGFKVWDLGGNLRYREMARDYYKRAGTFFLFYDITSRDSFNHITEWVLDITHKNFLARIIVVGNKCDLIKERVIDDTDVAYITDVLHLEHYYASSKTGDGIAKLFDSVAPLPVPSERELLVKGHDFIAYTSLVDSIKPNPGWRRIFGLCGPSNENTSSWCTLL